MHPLNVFIALSIINGLTRLIPGTLGDPDSLVDESHNSSLLEYPHYTRPQVFKEMKVPDILVSGNHEEIRLWREKKILIFLSKLTSFDSKKFLATCWVIVEAPSNLFDFKAFLILFLIALTIPFASTPG